MQVLNEQEILAVSGGFMLVSDFYQEGGGWSRVWELVTDSWNFWVNGRLPDRSDPNGGANTNGSFDNIPGDASAGA
jgi:hypothetical protein